MFVWSWKDACVPNWGWIREPVRYFISIAQLSFSLFRVRVLLPAAIKHPHWPHSGALFARTQLQMLFKNWSSSFLLIPEFCAVSVAERLYFHFLSHFQANSSKQQLVTGKQKGNPVWFYPCKEQNSMAWMGHQLSWKFKKSYLGVNSDW